MPDGDRSAEQDVSTKQDASAVRDTFENEDASDQRDVPGPTESDESTESTEPTDATDTQRSSDSPGDPETETAAKAETQTAADVRQQLRAETCGNCGAQREGPYCHVCGQRYRNGPLTFKDLWQQVVFVFFDLERGFLYTVRKMTTSPDQVARRYLDGEHRRFLSPVAYYLIMVTLLVIGYSLLEDAWIEQMSEGMKLFGTLSEDELQATYDALGVDNREDYLRYFFDKMVSYSQYLGVLSVGAIALGARVLLKERTVAEWLAVSLFVWGQISLYTCLFQFVTVYLAPLWTTLVGALVQTIMVAWTFSIFGESRWKSALLALLGMYGGIIVMSLIFGLMLVAIVALFSGLGLDVSQVFFGLA